MLRTLLLFCLAILLFSSLDAQYSLRDQKLGKNVFEMMDKTHGFYHDDGLQEWVERVGKQLESVLDTNYQFQYHITDQEELNAFATAGGYVFITRGLLALLSNDDELACVLAHELSHVTQRHASKTARASILPSILELPFNILGVITYTELGDLLNLPIELTSDIAISAFNRNQEREADALGVEMAYRAGYDPYQLISALEKLDAFTETAYHIKNNKSIFNDHPMTEDRVADIRTQLSKMDVEPKEHPSGTKIMAQDGILFGPNPRKGIVYNNEVAHLGLRFYMQLPKSYSVNQGSKALSAVSSDQKSSILISIDSLANDPETAARFELGQVKKIDILQTKRIRVNGLEAFQAVVENKRVKYPDMTGIITWIKNPVSGSMIRVVCISPSKSIDPHLEVAVNSIRMLKMEEIDDWSYLQLRLVEEKNIEKFKTTNPLYFQALQILNDLEKEEYEVEVGMKMKLLEIKPLSEFQ